MRKLDTATTRRNLPLPEELKFPEFLVAEARLQISLGKKVTPIVK